MGTNIIKDSRTRGMRKCVYYVGEGKLSQTPLDAQVQNSSSCP